MAFNPDKFLEDTDLEDNIMGASKAYGLDHNLLRGLIKQESNFNRTAGSSAGAQGYTQLMPGTAEMMGVSDILDGKQNIYGGAKYLSIQMKKFDNDPSFALAAYNSGPGNVSSARRKAHSAGLDSTSWADVEMNLITAPRHQKETKDYVKRIMGRYVPSTPKGFDPDEFLMEPEAEPDAGFNPDTFLSQSNEPSVVDVPQEVQPTSDVIGDMWRRGTANKAISGVIPTDLTPEQLELERMGEGAHEFRSPESIAEENVEARLLEDPIELPAIPPDETFDVNDPVASYYKNAPKINAQAKRAREARGTRSPIGKTLGEVANAFRTFTSRITTGIDPDAPTRGAQLGKRVQEAEDELMRRAKGIKTPIMEELKAVVEIVKEDPGKAAKVFGARMFEELPFMIATGRLSMSMINALKAAKSVSAARKIMSKSSFKTKLKGEIGANVSGDLVAGGIQESGRGSDYTAGEVALDVVTGVVTAPIAAGIGHLKDAKVGKIKGLEHLEGFKKLTQEEFNKIEKLTITKDMEKNVNIQEMIPLMQEIANSPHIKKQILGFDDDVKIETLNRKQLDARGYLDSEPGEYVILGHKVDGKAKITKVGDNATLIEEITHVLQDEIKRKNPALHKKIKIWENEVRRGATEGGYKVPKGDELFAQTFTSHMGYADKFDGVVKNLVLPDDIVKEVHGMMKSAKSKGDILTGKAKPDPQPLPVKAKPKPVPEPEPVKVNKQPKKKVKETDTLLEEMKSQDAEKYGKYSKEINEKFPDGPTNNQLMKYMWDNHKKRLTRKEASAMSKKAKALPEEVSDIQYQMRRLKNKVDVDDLDPIYKELLKSDPSWKEKLAPVKKAPGVVGRFIERQIVPISSKLARISPKFKYRARKNELEARTMANDRGKEIAPFIKGLKKMGKGDRKVIDSALRNGDMVAVNKVVEAHGLEDAYKSARGALDKMWEAADELGLAPGKIENYWPRLAKDPDKLLAYLNKSDGGSPVQRAIREKSAKLKRLLTDDEKIAIANGFAQGYIPKGTAKPGSFKGRKIEKIDAELDKFYDTPENAIARYIESTSTFLSAKKFFGKNLNKNVDGTVDWEGSIGALLKQEEALGNIKADDFDDLTGALTAYFSPGVAGGASKFYRNLSYIDTMGSITSAVTQLQDPAFSAGKYGVARTLINYFKKKKIKMDDIGIKKVSQEFAEVSTMTKAVETVFKATGLTFMDKLGKESFLNSAFDYFQSGLKKNKPHVEAKLREVFGDDIAKVKKDFIDGKVTDDVKLMLFNEISDVQPITLLEMPQNYAKGGNRRLIYMLKTFTIRQVDTMRQQAAKSYVEAVKNKDYKAATREFAVLFRMASAFVALGVGADTIKRIIMGRDYDIKDEVYDNMFKLIGTNKYTSRTFREKGPVEALKGATLPPTKLFQALFKDYQKYDKDGDIDISEMETIQSLPFGKAYYWWLGKGKTRTKKTKSDEVKAGMDFRPKGNKASGEYRPKKGKSSGEYRRK